MLLKSHYDGDLNGLSPHPKENKFLTICRGGLLGIWDAEKRRQTKYAKIECGADAVCYSNKGKYIAIGMTNGYLLVVSNDFKPEAKTQFSKGGERITECKFSPDDKICAVAGTDGNIKLYDVASHFKKAKTIKKSSGVPVEQMDFSTDGKYLVVNNINKEIFFFDTDTGKTVMTGPP